MVAGQEREWRDGYSAFELPNSPMMTLCDFSLHAHTHSLSPPLSLLCTMTLHEFWPRMTLRGSFILAQLSKSAEPAGSISFTLKEVPNLFPLPSNLYSLDSYAPAWCHYVNPTYPVVVHFLEKSTLFRGFALNNSYVWVLQGLGHLVWGITGGLEGGDLALNLLLFSNGTS